MKVNYNYQVKGEKREKRSEGEKRPIMQRGCSISFHIRYSKFLDVAKNGLIEHQR